VNAQRSRFDSARDRSGVIVLGGNFVGLGVVRSLGRHGIPVWVYDTRRSVAEFSRYTTRFVLSSQDKHELLLQEGRQHELNGWVVFPVRDADVEMLSINHRSLSSIYRLTTPPLDVTKFALDKRLTYRQADQLGIAIPWTMVSKTTLDETARALPYPVILKPAINHHFFPQTGIKALPVNVASELSPAYARMSRYIPPDEILIQERIPGGGENQYSFGGVFSNGKAYGSLVVRRRRQYPADFGVTSSFVETIDEPAVDTAGRRFLESIGFDGMAEVEFKFDSRDGKYKILDVNMRPWGWHAIGTRVGVDFAYLLWRLHTGGDVARVAATKTAAWLRELNGLVAIGASPGRRDALRSLLSAASRGRLVGATFALSDPLPFVAEFALRAAALFRRKTAQDSRAEIEL